MAAVLDSEASIAGRSSTGVYGQNVIIAAAWRLFGRVTEQGRSWPAGELWKCLGIDRRLRRLRKATLVLMLTTFRGNIDLRSCCERVHPNWRRA